MTAHTSTDATLLVEEDLRRVLPEPPYMKVVIMFSWRLALVALLMIESAEYLDDETLLRGFGRVERDASTLSDPLAGKVIAWCERRQEKNDRRLARMCQLPLPTN